MYDPIPFSCKTERACERASERERVCLHRWDCDGIRPEAGCLGPLLAILRYSLHALCWVRAEVPFLRSYTARTHTQSNSLVWWSHPCYQARGYGGNGIRQWAAPLQSECDSDDRRAQFRVLCTSSQCLNPPILMYLQP